MMARTPAEAFLPGEFLAEELEARGWTQTEFAEILGRPYRLVNEIIAGKRGITPETARGLAAALGTSAELWLNLEASYQLAQVGDADADLVARRAKLYELAPVKEMIRRGWLEPSNSIEVMEQRVTRFFEIARVTDTPYFLAAARKSTPYDAATLPEQVAWLYRARQMARTLEVGRFSPASLRRARARLQNCIHVVEETRHVPRILAENGIRFVIVQPLTRTKIDGACFWLDDFSPVVALSLRYDRIDNFWFVLQHELEHIAQKEDFSLDIDSENTADAVGRPTFEEEADRNASEHLVPHEKLGSFIARVRPLYSRNKIEGFARLQGVHPGIVVGQLQHRGEIKYSSLRKLLEPVRSVITAATLTDGWGASLSVLS